MIANSAQIFILKTINLIGLTFILVGGVFVSFSAFYLISILAGWIDGYALPNTALFRWWPKIRFLAELEPRVGHWLLMIGATGWCCSQIERYLKKETSLFCRTEKILEKGFSLFGLIILFALYFFSVGATWSGIPRAQDLGGSAISGLLPFNDAHGHFQYPLYQKISGEWNPFAARRPLATGFRTVLLMVANYNNLNFLMIQTAALAIATFFAASALMKHRGIWACLTFLGLTFIGTRPYLPTNLTEPLGIFWALLAIPFLLRAQQTSSLKDAAMGFCVNLWALLIRMGSMFTVLTMGLWIMISQAHQGYKKCIISCGAVLLIIFLNLLFVQSLQSIYGAKGSLTGSNFSYVICGLSLGGDWTLPQKIYKNELLKLQTEKQIADFLYKQSLINIQNDIKPLLKRLWQGEVYFIKNLPERMLAGYTNYIPKEFSNQLWWLCITFGLIVNKKNFRMAEILFWSLFFFGLFLSAPFVIFDDGWRILCVSFPLCSVFIGTMLCTKNLNHKNEKPRSTKTKNLKIGSLCFLYILVLVAPFLGRNLSLAAIIKNNRSFLKNNEDIFLGPYYMAGFMVFPDQEKLPKNFPSIHVSDFRKIVLNSGVEQYEKIVTPDLIMEPPFVFLAVSGMTRTGPILCLIPEVLSDPKSKTPVIMRIDPGIFWNKGSSMRFIQDHDREF